MKTLCKETDEEDTGGETTNYETEDAESEENHSNRVKVEVLKTQTKKDTEESLEKKINKVIRGLEKLKTERREAKGKMDREEKKNIKEQEKLLKKRKKNLAKRVDEISCKMKEVRLSGSRATPPLHVHISARIGSEKRKCVSCPDYGATHSLMSMKTLEKLKRLEKMNKEDNKYKIMNASGQRMDVSGGVKL